MSPSDYVKSTVDFLDQKQWDTSPNKVRDGVYIVLGQRADEAEGSRLVMMVVTEPESQITKNHLSYLYEIGNKKSADQIALSSNIHKPDEIAQIARNNDIQIIEPDTVLSETKYDKKDSSASIFGVSSPPESSNNCHNFYPSRIRVFFIGIVCLLLGFYSLPTLISEGFGLFDRGIITGLALIIGTPLFVIGGPAFCVIGVKKDPVIQITDEGIYYNQLTVWTQFYPWHEIKAVEKTQRNINFLYTQFFFEINVENITSNIKIGVSSFGIEFDEVAEAVRNYSDVPIKSDDNI